MLDQKKIGNYLRELRKNKNMTQEQLAEHFGTTSRSVSRWETGANLPDLSILVELASFYEVQLNDIINGEEEPEISVEKVVEYADADKEKLKRQMVRNNAIALIFVTIALILYTTNEVKLLLGFLLGLSIVVIIRNIFVFSGKSSCYRDRH